MTVEALAVILCLAKPTFSHGQTWNEAECLDQAKEIQAAAEVHGIDTKLIVAVNIHECDLRSGIVRPIWQEFGTGRRKKRVQIGADLCPMGLRVFGPVDRVKWTDAAIYMEAARKMDRWKKWCDHDHGGAHHFISHYNQGNSVYQFQILAIRRALAGKPLLKGEEGLLTERTLEIVKRLTRVFKKA